MVTEELGTREPASWAGGSWVDSAKASSPSLRLQLPRRYYSLLKSPEFSSIRALSPEEKDGLPPNGITWQIYPTGVCAASCPSRRAVNQSNRKVQRLSAEIGTPAAAPAPLARVKSTFNRGAYPAKSKQNRVQDTHPYTPNQTHSRFKQRYPVPNHRFAQLQREQGDD